MEVQVSKQKNKKRKRPSSSRGKAREVRFHQGREDQLPGHDALPGARGLVQRLLPVAQRAAVRAAEQQRAAQTRDQVDPHRESRHLRQPAHSRRVASTWLRDRPQPRGSLDGRNGAHRQRPRRFRKTTDSHHNHPIAPDLVERDFNPSAPNQLWAADITYIPTASGWAYLAVVLDLFSRRVIGWAVDEHMRTELVLEALDRALGTREHSESLVHHSDRGSQYASSRHREELERRAIRVSMGAKGCAYDNAVVESFFTTLKKDLVYRTNWLDPHQAALTISEYIQVFYNRRRRQFDFGLHEPDRIRGAAHGEGGAGSIKSVSTLGEFQFVLRRT